MYISRFVMHIPQVDCIFLGLFCIFLNLLAIVFFFV